MLSRIFWISLAGIALVGGMILQGGGGIFSWGDDAQISEKVEQTIEDRVEHAIDTSFDRMTVVSSDGEEIDVPAATKRAMAGAVGELVKAETDLALADIGESSDEAMAAARLRREKARAEVDRLEAEIKGYGGAKASDGAATSEQIKQEIRDDVRETVREAVRN